MPKLYENSKSNFSSFDEFKEIAVKAINETFGRVRPLDVFDFSENDTDYKCVAYYNDEKIPEEQPVGEVVSDESAEAERVAREQDEANKQKAKEDAEAHKARLSEAVAAGLAISPEDAAIAAALGIADDLALQTDSRLNALKDHYKADDILIEDDVEPGKPVNFRFMREGNVITTGTLVELEAAVASRGENEHQKRLKQNGASDAAVTLAAEHGVDLSQVEGTGRDGVIKKSDVEDYIKNNAPMTENADAGIEQQPDA